MSALESPADDVPANGSVTCRVTLFGAEIAIAGPAALRDVLADQLAIWNPRITSDVLDARMRVVTTTPAGTGLPEPRYRLQADDEALVDAAPLDDVLTGLQRWIDTEVIRLVRHLTPVHAGVVGWRDRAIVLPAPSGAGKTALVAMLVAAGATYYSDELAFLDDRGWIHAYPRHLLMRDAMGISRVTPPASLAAGTRAPGARPAPPPIPPGLILGLRFKASAAFRLERITGSECLIYLLANTPHRVASMREVPAGLVRAVALAEAYHGVRGDARDASAQILALAERAAP